MGKVVVVSQEAVDAMPSGSTLPTRVSLPIELHKAEVTPQREILVNVVSTGGGTDFIVLRPEDLPGGAPGTSGSVAGAQRYCRSTPGVPLRGDVALAPLPEDGGAGNSSAWVTRGAQEHTKLVSHLGAPQHDARRGPFVSEPGPTVDDLGAAGARHGGSSVTLGGLYNGSTLVGRPDLHATEANVARRDAPVLVRPVEGKPVEGMQLAAVDAYPMRPLLRGVVEVPAFDDGLRQRSHWGQYSHLSPREKNRQAQRRFRERQKTRVLTLQKEVQRLTAENACLRSDLSKSHSDKERLVQVVSNLMQKLDKEPSKEERS